MLSELPGELEADTWRGKCLWSYASNRTSPTHTLARRERRPQQRSGRVATRSSLSLPTSFLPDGGNVSAHGGRRTALPSDFCCRPEANGPSKTGDWSKTRSQGLSGGFIFSKKTDSFQKRSIPEWSQAAVSTQGSALPGSLWSHHSSGCSLDMQSVNSSSSNPSGTDCAHFGFKTKNDPNQCVLLIAEILRPCRQNTTPGGFLGAWIEVRRAP